MKSARTLVTIRSHRFLLVALLLVLAGVTGPGACHVHDVQCGDVLDIDHGQYRLSGDLVCPFTRAGSSRHSSLRSRWAGDIPGSAVMITGDNVHFNLAGHTITRDDGTGAFLEQGIAVLGANAHINGGSIVDINCPPLGSGDCTAIRLFEAPGATINGMSLHNNTVGIVSFDSGNADGARIHTNDITGNLRWGIGLFGSAEGAMITGNDLSDTSGFIGSAGDIRGAGYIGTSDGVSLIGNVANNCARNGIVLRGDEFFPPAQRNTVRDNATLNGFNGINSTGRTEAFRPHDNLIQGNTSFGNSNRDLGEQIGAGEPQADCLNTWKDNDFDVAAPDCIE